MLERLSIYQASRRLGISESAVRQRIHRQTLQSGKDETGRLVVYVPADAPHSTNYNGDTTHMKHDDSTTLTSDYIDTLKSQIESLQQDKEVLQRDKEQYQEESARKDTLLAQLNQTLAELAKRIPAIEAPAAASEDAPEPRDSAVSAADEESKGAVPNDSPERELKQSWWRRFIG